MTGILNALIAGVSGAVKDAYFNLVSLLLPGNGTNGAQNNTFLDSSTNNFTITRNGNTTQGTFSPFSQTGWGNYFTGSGSTYLTVPDSTSWVIDTDYTIEFWVYASSFPGQYNNIVAQRNSGGTAYWGLNYDTSLGWAFFWNNGSGETKITRNQNSPLNNWVHVAVTRSSGTGYMFLNGNQAGSTFTFGAISDIVSSLFIGAWPTGGDLFNGYLSNLRITKGRAVYTSAFNPSTVPLTRTSGGTNPPQGSECVLLTCQSNRFLDSNGVNTPATSPLTITTSGSPSVVAFSPFNPTAKWSAATYGGSGYFDGTGDMLETPSINFGASIFCFECWLYPTATQGSNTGIFAANSTNGIQLSYYDGGSPGGLGIAQKGVAWQLFNNDGVKPIVNQWNHVAFVRSGTGTNQTSIFLNGTRIANGTISYTYSASLYQLSTTNSSGPVFQGYISGTRLTIGSTPYDATLTTLTVPTAPPTAITNTSLLLNFTNAGIYDATSKNDLETVGNAQISTTQSKWGGSSMSFDGTGDYLFEPHSTLYEFGSGDFTIEFWARANSLSGTYTGVVGVWVAGGTSTANSWNVQLNAYNATNKFGFSYTQSSTSYDLVFNATTSTGSWDHYAIVRSGGTLYGFKNGTSQALSSGSSTISGAINNGTNGLYVGTVGTAAGGTDFNGYINDLRITKGLARYTANFTAPTAPFPQQ